MKFNMHISFCKGQIKKKEKHFALEHPVNEYFCMICVYFSCHMNLCTNNIVICLFTGKGPLQGHVRISFLHNAVFTI